MIQHGKQGHVITKASRLVWSAQQYMHQVSIIIIIIIIIIRYRYRKLGGARMKRHEQSNWIYTS